MTYRGSGRAGSHDMDAVVDAQRLKVDCTGPEAGMHTQTHAPAAGAATK